MIVINSPSVLSAILACGFEWELNELWGKNECSVPPRAVIHAGTAINRVCFGVEPNRREASQVSVDRAWRHGSVHLDKSHRAGPLVQVAAERHSLQSGMGVATQTRRVGRGFNCSIEVCRRPFTKCWDCQLKGFGNLGMEHRTPFASGWLGLLDCRETLCNRSSDVNPLHLETIEECLNVISERYWRTAKRR